MLWSDGAVDIAEDIEEDMAEDREDMAEAHLEEVINGETGAILVLSVEARCQQFVSVFVLEKVCDTVLGISRNISNTLPCCNGG